MQGTVFDDRPKLQKMRRFELCKMVKEAGWPVQDAEDMTKDEMIHVLSGRRLLPSTMRLGQKPEDVPMREWTLNALRIECKSRGLKIPFAAGKDTLLAILEGKAQPGFVPETDEQRAAESA